MDSCLVLSTWLLMLTVLVRCALGIDYYDESNEHIKMLKQKLKALDSHELEEFVDAEEMFGFNPNRDTVKVKEDSRGKVLCLRNFDREYCVTLQKKYRGLMDIKGEMELVVCILKNVAVGWRAAAALCWDSRTRRDYPRDFHLKPLSETVASVE